MGPYQSEYGTRATGKTTTDYKLNDNAAYVDPFGTTYSDGEIIRTAYDASGQARRLYRQVGAAQENIVTCA